jgi:hypothetical protein
MNFSVARCASLTARVVTHAAAAAAVPAEIVELTKSEKYGRRPAEQEDETERAIDECTSSRGISGQRLVRKVVGVGM